MSDIDDRPAVQTQPARRFRPWMLIPILAVVAGIAAGMVVFTSGSSSDTFPLSGSVTIRNPFGPTPTIQVLPDGTCQGYSGYGDLASGAIVQVSDGTGHVLGTGSLTPGQQVPVGGGVYGCKMAFTVPNVSETDTYVVQVANRNRMVETPAQVKAGIDLTIG